MEGQNQHTIIPGEQSLPNLQQFLNTKKVSELQVKLKRLGLSPYGRKASLVARLLSCGASMKDLLLEEKQEDDSNNKRKNSCSNNRKRKKRQPGSSEDDLVPIVCNQELATPKVLTETFQYRWRQLSSRIAHLKELASALTNGQRLTGVDVELLLLAVVLHRPPVDPRFPLIGPVRMAKKNPFREEDNNGQRTCYFTTNRWDPDFAFIYMVVRSTNDRYIGLFVARRKVERTLDVVLCDSLTGPREALSRTEKLALDKLLIYLNHTEEGKPYLLRIHGEELGLTGMCRHEDSSSSDFCVAFLFPILLKGRTVATLMNDDQNDHSSASIGPMELEDPYKDGFASALHNTFPEGSNNNDNKRSHHHRTASTDLGRALTDALEGDPSPGGLLRACHRVADAALAEKTHADSSGPSSSAGDGIVDGTKIAPFEAHK